MLDKSQKEKLNIKTGEFFAPVPANKYTLQIGDVDLVTKFNTFTGKEQDYLNYQFVILTDSKMVDEYGKETDESVRGRFVWKRCSQSMNEKSWLYRLARAACKKDFSVTEKESFDPESLIGKQVDAMVSVDEGKDGKVWNNILAFSPTTKELEPFKGLPGESKETESTKGVDDFEKEMDALKNGK